MSERVVTVEKSGPIGYMVLNRPPANSYNLEFMEDLNAAIEEVRRDDEIKVVITRSALDRFFSAGADIKAFASGTPESNARMVAYAHEVLFKIQRTPKIFIAAIAGHALGGGLEIALAHDLRFGAEGEYKLGLPEVTLGLLPGNGGTQRLPRLIGRSKALDLMITGRTVSPQEAYELGILDRLYPADELLAKAEEYAQALAAGATKAIGLIKLAVNEGLEVSLDVGMVIERQGINQLFASEDAQEGFQAFLEKRKPQFKGR